MDKDATGNLDVEAEFKTSLPNIKVKVPADEETSESESTVKVDPMEKQFIENKNELDVFQGSEKGTHHPEVTGNDEGALLQQEFLVNVGNLEGNKGTDLEVEKLDAALLRRKQELLAKAERLQKAAIGESKADKNMVSDNYFILGSLAMCTRPNVLFNCRHVFWVQMVKVIASLLPQQLLTQVHAIKKKIFLKCLKRLRPFLLDDNCQMVSIFY